MKTSINQCPALFFKVPLLIVISLTALLSCIEKRELKESKYPNGQLEEQYYVKIDKQGNYVRNGKYNKWYASGQKEVMGAYKNRPATDTATGSTGIPLGGRDGKWTFWYENGQKKQECTYENGKSEGPYTAWHKNGQKQEESFFKVGKPDGLVTLWYEGGQKHAVASYKNGVGISETDWYENGQKEREKTTYPFLVTFWYENGQKESEVHGSDTSNFQSVSWYDNGKKQNELARKDGKNEGPFHAWFKSGQKQIECTYKNGELEGVSTIWYENGQKESEGTYQDGKCAAFTSWFENGKKYREGCSAGADKINSDKSQQSSANLIASFSGSGTKSTRPFTVNGPWEIQWNVYPGTFGLVVFVINLYDADGNLIDMITTQSEAGPGSSYQPKAGTYYLNISGNGRWAVKIVSTN